MKAAFRRFVAVLLERQVRRLIASHHLRVVAVGGSVGKTSTRAFIAAVLQQKFSTQSITQPGYNSEIGLPLSVFEMTVPSLLINPFAWVWRLIRTEQIIRSAPRYQVLVLELGTDHPGEIPRYLRYLSPDISVMTAVTPEHMENFPGGLDAVAAEELALAAASKQFVAAYDDVTPAHRHKYIDHHPRHYYYGLSRGLDYRVFIVTTDPVAGTVVTLVHNGVNVLENFTLPVYGAPIAKAAVAAYAVADLLGLSRPQIEAGLAQLRPMPGRMNPLQGVGGSRIIDDTYNSSPDAVVAALAALASAPAQGRRIAILGSMNELGSDSPRYHEQVGEAASGVDLLVTVGELASGHLGPAAVRAGLDPTRFRAADSPYAAGEYVKTLLGPGDLVLVKGSQNGVYLEEAVKILLANPADTENLVRQSPAWLRAKTRQFKFYR